MGGRAGVRCRPGDARDGAKSPPCRRPSSRDRNPTGAPNGPSKFRHGRAARSIPPLLRMRPLTMRWCRRRPAAAGQRRCRSRAGAWPSAAPGTRKEAHAPGGAALDSWHPRRRRGRARPYCGIRRPSRERAVRDRAAVTAPSAASIAASSPTPLPNRHRGRCIPPRRPP